ncbi:hypothetical protein FOZ63_019725 [Perkinsus olseni]|uniref:Uncharacterized protein n=1 Tax=Perkinsus olseni TaxID=32597 RepID=A0A7J6RG13_PEROL|nr:hypothetical protein FOZ62_021194 [Perkinsus olseni]KAF4719573.1 hypothetical protein FOZ63_019725 [Perkinsus olseni]
MATEANNANDIVSSPVLILIIVAMTLFFTFGALMALRAPSGSKWRAIILPKMGVIFASLLVWFVFTGSDVYTVLILCIPVAGPMLAALWLWYRDRRRARRNRKAAEKLAQAARQQSLFIDVEEGEGFRLMDRTVSSRWACSSLRIAIVVVFSATTPDPQRGLRARGHLARVRYA